MAPGFSFLLWPPTRTVPGPHLWGCGLPGSRGLLPSPLEVGAVSWALGLRSGAISGALAGLGLAIPTFCGGLLGWPGAERPGARSEDPEGTGAQCRPRPSLLGSPQQGQTSLPSFPIPGVLLTLSTWAVTAQWPSPPDLWLQAPPLPIPGSPHWLVKGKPGPRKGSLTFGTWAGIWVGVSAHPPAAGLPPTGLSLWVLPRLCPGDMQRPGGAGWHQLLWCPQLFPAHLPPYFLWAPASLTSTPFPGCGHLVPMLSVPLTSIGCCWLGGRGPRTKRRR